MMSITLLGLLEWDVVDCPKGRPEKTASTPAPLKTHKGCGTPNFASARNTCSTQLHKNRRCSLTCVGRRPTISCNSASQEGRTHSVSIEENFHDRADHFALPHHRKDRRRRHGRDLGGRRYAVGPPCRAEIFARRARTGCFGARAAEARSAGRLFAEPSAHLHDP